MVLSWCPLCLSRGLKGLKATLRGYPGGDEKRRRLSGATWRVSVVQPIDRQMWLVYNLHWKRKSNPLLKKKQHIYKII